MGPMRRAPLAPGHLFPRWAPALLGLVTGLAPCVWMAPPALAYPTSVVFTPTGAVADFGRASVYSYTGFYREGLNYWTGLQLGILPGWAPFGEEGPAFGGVEAGLDLIAGLGSVPLYKPMANVKVGLLAEGGWWPSVGVGFSNFAFTSTPNSLNAAYGVASRTLSVGGRELGSLTLGGMACFPADPAAFSPTPPLPAPMALLAGYQLPKIGPFGMGIDHVGGNSELSSTNLVFNVELVPGAGASIGYAFGHDRSVRGADAVFSQVYADFSGADLLKAISAAQGAPTP